MKSGAAQLIADPGVAERLIAKAPRRGADRKDEVWEGVYVIMPDPNVEHQRLVMRLGVVFCEVVNPPAGGEVFPGLNLWLRPTLTRSVSEVSKSLPRLRFGLVRIVTISTAGGISFRPLFA